MKLLHSAAEAAKLFGVSERTWRGWTETRVVPSILVGRVLKYDIVACRVALEAFARQALSPSGPQRARPRPEQLESLAREVRERLRASLAEQISGNGGLK